MEISENLYVSITSWYKRICNVKSVLEKMLEQTLKPYKIIVNLCIQDFPNYEEDLPEDLLEFINQHSDKIEVYWFIENYKGWKKHLHTLEIVEDNDLIVSIDDDWIYHERFLESLYLSYCYYRKKYPICNDIFDLTANFWSFYGPGTLYWKGCFPADYKKYLSKEVLYCNREDLIIFLLFCINNTIIMPNKFTVKSLEAFNAVDPMTVGCDMETHNKVIRDSAIAVEKMLEEHYFKGENPGYHPSFWKVLEKFHEYCKSIENPFPELEFINKVYEDNYLCHKKEVIEGNWIAEKLHLNIDLWS